MIGYERVTSRTKFTDVTTAAFVDVYNSGIGIFESLLKEVKDLSKKKSETTMSKGKVKIINRVLEDLLVILKQEPTGKYLDLLDDEALPQISDAVLIMVQFESALNSFKRKYYKHFTDLNEYRWIAGEHLKPKQLK